MPTKAFEKPPENLGDEIQLRKLDLRLYHVLWNFELLSSNIRQLSYWEVIKYLNDNGVDFNPSVESIPSDKGGLYIFLIKSPMIEGLTEFPMYVGRAQITRGQNLKKRVKEYLNQYKNKSMKRERINKLFRFWKDFIYVAYFPLDDNHDIIEYEKILINSLNFPLNDKIPNKIISNAVKAYSS